MITPTSGTALVGGFDIRTDIHKVRESLGLCPQHNVLFEDLTVREHLYFFGKVSRIGSFIAVKLVILIVIFLTLMGIIMYYYCLLLNIKET
jgi:ABC-type multidrug transport system ATPase subunit